MGKRKPRKKSKALAKRYCHKNTEVFNSIVAPPIVSIAVKLQHGGKWYVGYGGARCCRLDEFDEERGHKIAMGRAATDIALQLVEAGEAPWKTA